MKLLADENIDRPVVVRLRAEGHEVFYVLESSPEATDSEVIRRSEDEPALLLTADKDFGEIVFRQRRITNGVILMRLYGVSPERKADIVALFLREHAAELPGSFTVVTHGGVRIRRLKNT